MPVWLSLHRTKTFILLIGKWVTEEIVPGWRQQFLIDEVMIEEKNEMCHLAVFKNKSMGDILVIEVATYLVGSFFFAVIVSIEREITVLF